MNFTAPRNAVWLRFLGYWTVVQLAYFRAWRAGFVTDFTGLAERLDTQPFWDFWNCFGFPALEQVTHAALWILYRSFGTEPLGWYLAFTLLHALNGWQLDRLVRALGGGLGVRRTTMLAGFAGLAFLLSPYQTETVLWKVQFNFLASSFLIFTTLLATVRYWKTDAARHHWTAFGATLVAFFTFELALVLPFMVASIALFLPDARRMFRRIALPQFGLLVGYFLLNRLVLGAWVGHYGAETHLNVDPPQILGNFWRYGTKFLLFVRNWTHDWKAAQNEHLVSEPWVYVYTAAAVLLGVLFWRNYRTLAAELRLAGLGLLLYGWSLLPVANLYYAYILHVENDRYGYLPMAFFAVALGAVLWRAGRWVFWIGGGAYLLLSSWFLGQNVGYWQQNAHVYNNLLETFPEVAPTDTVYLMAFPDNYRGTPMFKNYSKGHTLVQHSLEHVAHRPAPAHVVQVTQFNMETPVDSFHVSGSPRDSVHLEFAQWGNWWWRNAIGGATYTTERYKWKRDAHRSHLIFKTPPDSTRNVLLWTAGAEWRQLEGYEPRAE